MGALESIVGAVHEAMRCIGASLRDSMAPRRSRLHSGDFLQRRRELNALMSELMPHRQERQQRLMELQRSCRWPLLSEDEIAQAVEKALMSKQKGRGHGKA